MKSLTRVVFAVVISLGLFANPVLAKQCVWNKAGFILDVTWTYNEQVVREDQILLGQGTCSDDNAQYGVILSIVGGEVADAAAHGALAFAAGLLGFVPGLTPGAAAAVATAAAGGASFLDQFIPEPENTFYAGVPSSEYYLDVWGTIWDPQVGDGGPIW
jgi:hypothetical protein